jgi:Restriction endonuclease
MASDGLFLVGLVIGAGAGAWAASALATRKEDQENLKLHKQLQADIQRNKITFDTKELFHKELEKQFINGYAKGRKWLVFLVAELSKEIDEYIANRLSSKKPPAFVAAEEVKKAKQEKRLWKEKAKTYEYQLLTLREYFPFIADYEDAIYDENFDLKNETSDEALANSDQVLRFLSKDEYTKLPASERNQLALTRYLNGKLSPQAIGRLYERYVGYRYEVKGWTVEYHGIEKGLEDLGMDLICTSGNQILIIQAKCWAEHKPIRERHVFQLYGTTQLLKLQKKFATIPNAQFKMQLVTSSKLSDVAQNAAENLGILIWSGLKLDKNFPLIKCNINSKTKEKIYHLPFDQQYENTKISKVQGEFFALTCADAEKAGFRRAFRFTG